MRGLELVLNFGHWGSTPVVLFHPKLGTVWSTEHIIFIPPFACSDISPYVEKLNQIAERQKGILYALKFSASQKGSLTRIQRVQKMKLISGAILHLRGGCSKLCVYTCSKAISRFVETNEHFNPNQDKVSLFSQLG